MSLSNLKKILLGLVLVGALAASVVVPFQAAAQLSDDPNALANEAHTAEAQKTPDGEEQAKKIDCDSLVGGGFGCVVAKWVNDFIFNTVGVITSVAGLFLNYVIEVTILQFSTWVTNITGISVAWEIFRDALTLLFIFLLLYAGIKMILGLGGSEKIIKGVLLAGLLVNFSFFFTSVIIDASNVLTVELYRSIEKIGEAANEYRGAATSTDFARARGITAIFMQAAGPKFELSGQLADGEDVDSHIFQQMILSIILLLILAFIFFAMGFLLLARFVVLIVLLITSPISVMGGLLPQLNEHANKWWKELINQISFAPIMMLFMVIAVLVVTSDAFQHGLIASSDSASIVDLKIPLRGGIMGLINYGILIGLLVMGIVIAKKGAGAAAGMSAKIGGAAAGVSAWAGRRSLGFAASKVADSRWLKEKAENGGFVGRNLSRAALVGGKFGAGASFDVRNAPGLKAVGLGGVIDGKAEKGGYEGWYKKQKKDREERLKLYGGVETSETANKLGEAQTAELRAKDAHAEATAAKLKTDNQLIEERRKLKEAEERAKKGEDTKEEVLYRNKNIERLEKVAGAQGLHTEQVSAKLETASKERAVAEDQAKKERLESQQRLARQEQSVYGARTAETGFGKFRGGIMSFVASNPAEREAAESLEKSAGKDIKKTLDDLALHQLERDEAIQKELIKTLETGAEEQVKAIKTSNERLDEITRLMGEQIADAKKRGIWDYNKHEVRSDAGPAGAQITAAMQKLTDDRKVEREKLAESEETRQKKIDENKGKTQNAETVARLEEVEKSISKNAKGFAARDKGKKKGEVEAVFKNLGVEGEKSGGGEGGGGAPKEEGGGEGEEA